MKTLGGAASKSADSETAEAAPSGDNNGFFTANDKIDFSNVKVEPLFEGEVDFDTFSKSDFRAVKVKECVAVKKSKKAQLFIGVMTVISHCLKKSAQFVQKKRIE